MPKMDSPAVLPPITKLEEALKLHAMGLWIVPQYHKRAIIAGWDKFRLSEDDLREYLSDGRCNIAIALHQSPLVDIECDSIEAERELSRLVPDMPKTPTYKSKRGLHRLFLRPAGLPERAKIDLKGGIECRIANGKAALSTVPPSVHQEGHRYEWVAGLSLWNMPCATLPPTLTDLLRKSSTLNLKSESIDSSENLIPEGVRNDCLFRLGCRLVRSEMRPEVIVEVLKAENLQRCSPPLPDAEIDAICKSVEEQRARQVAKEMGSLPCATWKELKAAWDSEQGGAMRWTEPLDYALRVMLAVCLSTEQVGDQQLFCMVIGEPGSAKSRLAAGLCVSKKCYALDYLTGFHSGWKDASGEDFSLLARINRKTWVTSEGDTLLSNPRFAEIMSQQRKIFDGSSSAVYKNRIGELKQDGLRTPWIILGTPTLLSADQSRLGDRFMRVIIESPQLKERKAILRHVSRTAFADVRERCNGSPDSIISDRLRRAYQLTGGFVDTLRERAGELLCAVEVDGDRAGFYCEMLAEYAAMMRARMDPRGKAVDAEKHDGKELPTRLTYQFSRLAVCLAAVEGRRRVDNAVLRTVRQVALDTSKGRSSDIARVLWVNPEGLTIHQLENQMHETEDRVKSITRFMRKIGIIEPLERDGRMNAGVPLVLTPRAKELCDYVFPEPEEGK